MKTTKCMSMLAALWVTGFVTGPARGQDADAGPIADGGQLESFAARHPRGLIAPEAEALTVELPPTIVPAGGSDSPCDEVGYIEPAGQDVRTVLNALLWTDTPDGGKVARLELRSPGAEGLRVELTDIRYLELRVYDPVSGAAFGPYRYPRTDEQGRWWSTVIFGDTIGLEWHLPAHHDLPQPLPEIVSVAYLYEPLMADGPPPAGTCEPDVTCYPAWNGSVEERAVGLLLYNCTLTSCGQCTGAMLNRSPSDIPTGWVSPIFMTARHCINTQAAANTAIVIWDFKTTTCNGTAPNQNTLPRNDGALLLKTSFQDEWTILGLFERDDTGNYAGWDANFLGDGSFVTSVNHGAGQPKRIAAGGKTGGSNCLGAPNEWTVEYTLGRTIPGASGSPLFDDSRRVRGTLSCDNRMCPPDQQSWYGRFDTAFGMLQYYLFAMPNPTYANRFVGGDPGNDGTGERGTAANPFNTVYEATFCVPTYGTVEVVPGNYNERFTVWRPMTLVRSGGSGMVVLGAP